MKKNKIRGVITYIIEGDNVLLIYKKRGHGKDWFNGPGGKILSTETPLEAASRETQEEVGVTPRDPELCGFIRFYDVYDEDWDVYIFRSYGYNGTIRESEEAKPVWFSKDKIPYDRMWEDDRYWLPVVLEGGYFIAEFRFRGDKMLDKNVKTMSREEFYKKVKELS